MSVQPGKTHELNYRGLAIMGNIAAEWITAVASVVSAISGRAGLDTAAAMRKLASTSYPEMFARVPYRSRKRSDCHWSYSQH